MFLIALSALAQADRTCVMQGSFFLMEIKFNIILQNIGTVRAVVDERKFTTLLSDFTVESRGLGGFYDQPAIGISANL